MHMHLRPHARTAQVKDSELNFAVLSQLLCHPKAVLARFPFPLLPTPHAADPHECASDSALEWCDRLAKLLPGGWEYRETLPPTHKAPGADGGGEEDGEGADGDVPTATPGLIELLLWAVLDGRDRLAECLWRECEEPLRYALMTSQLYAHLASQEASGRKCPLAEKYEQWAVATLAECTEAVGMSLVEGHTARWQMCCLDLALQGESRHLVAHEYCQSIIAQRWYSHSHSSAHPRTPAHSLMHARTHARLIVAAVTCVCVCVCVCV